MNLKKKPLTGLCVPASSFARECGVNVTRYIYGRPDVYDIQSSHSLIGSGKLRNDDDELYRLRQRPPTGK